MTSFLVIRKKGYEFRIKAKFITVKDQVVTFSSAAIADMTVGVVYIDGEDVIAVVEEKEYEAIK